MKVSWWEGYLRLLPSIVLIAMLVLQSSAPFFVLAATQSATVNVTALVLPTPPTQPATIDSPVNGSVFQTTPLVVTGTCGAGLLVRLYVNNQLAGSIPCDPSGVFTMNINLLIGMNILTAMNFDSYEQAGPSSPNVAVEVVPPSAQTTISRQSDGRVGSQPKADESRELLFHNTIIEPLAKVVGVGTVVSPRVNQVMSWILNFIFLLAVLGAVLVTLL